MKRNIDYVKELLIKKGKKITTEEEREKVENLKSIFQKDDIFLDMDISTAFGILSFLEVPEEDIAKLYFELISPENYIKTSKPYFSIK